MRDTYIARIQAIESENNRHKFKLQEVDKELTRLRSRIYRLEHPSGI